MVSTMSPAVQNWTHLTDAEIDNYKDSSQNFDLMEILSIIIASVGITSNFTVIIVFLRDKKLRIKIPNILIIHQVTCLNSDLRFGHQNSSVVDYRSIIFYVDFDIKALPNN